MDPLTILALVQAHWGTIVAVATAIPVLLNFVKDKAYGVFFQECLDLVEKVAVLELSGADKRKYVVDAAYGLVPPWVKQLIPMTQAELIAEQAYSVLQHKIATDIGAPKSKP